MKDYLKANWVFLCRESLIIFFYLVMTNMVLVLLAYSVVASYYHGTDQCPEYRPQARIPTSHPDGAVFCAPEIFFAAYEKCNALDCATYETQNFLNRSINTDLKLVASPAPPPPSPAPTAPVETFGPSAIPPRVVSPPSPVISPGPPAVPEVVKTAHLDGPYYVRFKVANKQLVYKSGNGDATVPPSARFDHMRAHSGTIHHIEIESYAASPSVGMLRIGILIGSETIGLSTYVADVTHYTGTSWYNGTCQISISETSGSRGNLMGNGNCKTLIARPKGELDMPTEDLTNIEFNIKMLGDGFSIE